LNDTHDPNDSTLTFSPAFPNRRYSMVGILWWPRKGARRMDGHTWIAWFAERLGLEPPDAALVEELLALAGDAAHASERIAAPIACYLV
jgi:hypothetical protein